MAGHPGTFNDGRTAARTEVLVSFEGDGLRLTDTAGGLIGLWPYAALRHRDEVFGAGEIRLRLADEEGARLSLSGAAVLEELVRHAPQLRVARRGAGGLALKWTLSAVGAVLALLGVIWYGLPGFAHLAAAAVPVAWEVKLGDQLFEPMTRILVELEGKEERVLCEAEAGRRALDALTARLAGPDPAYPFRVAVLDMDTPNAFALPGGRVVLLRGLLDFVQAPEEVAGVLAHEMGHVVERHGTQGIMRSLGLTFFFGVMLGDVGSGAIGLAGEALITTAFSREAEHQADVAAVEILQRSDVRVAGLVDFFARLKEKYGDTSGALALLATHPSHGEREKLFAASGAQGGAAMSAADWQALKRICG